MKLGFGLYRHMLTPENYRFARQSGATHLIIHLVDYFGQQKKDQGSSNQPVGAGEGWGPAGDENKLWQLDELLEIKKEINRHGLELAGIENFDPAHWYDVLLDGPKRDKHLDNCKTIIRNLGEAGIPIFGYNFSIAGVAGRIKDKFARGEAESVGMDGVSEVIKKPVPKGMVWNMVYDPGAMETGVLPEINHAELWRRLKGFLDEILPVAEASGVVMAAHPDDPPLPYIRKQPRLVYQPHMYNDLIQLNPSPSNKLEFCLGTLSEMTEGDIYEVTDHFTKMNRVAYIHFRNVQGKVPYYRETFIDDGDIDMKKIVDILKKNKYEGVLIPDHTPLMSCDAPWHAGMAFAMGYMKALMIS
ncbi:MAG: mannonate dehydratase [Saprospiraceae bacterium]|nr:mannonate dehydratase [Saprospiraceae bacterium]